jgi:hypothetical protein
VDTSPIEEKVMKSMGPQNYVVHSHFEDGAVSSSSSISQQPTATSMLAVFNLFFSPQFSVSLLL